MSARRPLPAWAEIAVLPLVNIALAFITVGIIVRIIGVDGPRWMLQGLIGGAAALDEAQAAKAIELFRSTVVCRGVQPMPPRELIPLTAPKSV